MLLSIKFILIVLPLLLLFLLIIFIFMLFSDPTEGLEAKYIPVFYYEAKSRDIDWSILMAYTYQKNDAEDVDTYKIKTAADNIQYYKEQEGNTQGALSILLDSKIKAFSVIKSAEEFKAFFEPFFFEHRFPLHVFDSYFMQDTYGVENDLWTKPHNGVDISGNQGLTLFPVTRSEVVKINTVGAGGNAVTLQDLEHPEIKYYYAHLSEFGPHIELGKVVDLKDIVGFVGSTGNSTGPHLHFMIFVEGEHTDPFFMLEVWEEFDYYYERNDPAEWAKRNYIYPEADFYVSGTEEVGNTVHIYDRSDHDDTVDLEYHYRVITPGGSKTTYSSDDFSLSLSSEGRYQIKLSITDGNGFTDSFTKTLYPTEPPEEDDDDDDEEEGDQGD
ncbi:M23 family metallopeptidase [Longirhabdus pacifica]|uniref:M23 family metallopeptidase n=1 Tax=Longirhabdus pacifica TaxID=2305227 RepID=UPI0013E8A812|nr:M23 family metallopeptidase [Longirhabdus pacifica]